MFAFGFPDWWSLKLVVIGVFVFMIIAVNNEVQRLINSSHDQNPRNIRNSMNSSLLVLLFDTLYF